MPATTTRGVATPASRASNARYASYSTCARRVGTRVGGASRYATKRHARASSCASASSRPRATIRTGPVAVSATNTARPTGWSRAARTPVASTPSAASASSTCPTAGRPTGVPNTHSTACATPHPSTMAAIRSVGKPRERYRLDSANRATSASPMRRVGRVRCGEATSTVATATVTRTMGKRGAPVRSKVTRKASQSPESCTRNARRRPSTHADAAGDRQVAGQAPTAQEEHGHRQEAHRPQRGQLVEDQEERAGTVRDRVEEADDRFLGRGGVVCVQHQRHEEQGGHHRRAASPGRRRDVPSVRSPRGDVAEVGQQRPDRAHHPPCHARPSPGGLAPSWRGRVAVT